MSVGDRDAYYHIDTKMLDEFEAMVRKNADIVTRYDVPFGAGYAKGVGINGKRMVIYIDRHVPLMVRIGRKDVSLIRYWICHEWVEKALETPVYLEYFLRHQVAERFEESAVKSDGIDPRVYDSVCDGILSDIYKIGEWHDCPPDLDMTPYNDTKDPCRNKMWAGNKKLA